MAREGMHNSALAYYLCVHLGRVVWVCGVQHEVGRSEKHLRSNGPDPVQHEAGEYGQRFEYLDDSPQLEAVDQSRLRTNHLGPFTLVFPLRILILCFVQVC